MRFLIEKNSHYCNFNFFPFFTFSRKLCGTFKLIGDFSYEIDKQKDTNKIIGFSDSYHHHKSSVRIGWRWCEEENKTEILVIRYMNGERTITPLCFVNQDEENVFEIKISKHNYFVKVNNNSLYLLRMSGWKLWFPKIILRPYFGGTTKAPKDFEFNITKRA